MLKTQRPIIQYKLLRNHSQLDETPVYSSRASAANALYHCTLQPGKETDISLTQF